MKSPLRILYLEDEQNDVALIQAKLEAEGFACDMTHVETHVDFVAALDKGALDIILADYKLPSFDGLSALAIAREKTPDVPFIFVSGVMGEERAIKTLQSGATDYVLKQSLSRLGPAIRRALKEAEEHLERKEAEEALRRIEWLLQKKPAVHSSEVKQDVGQAYGNLSKLNTTRLILDSVGEEVLSDIIRDYLSVLETSSAVYEKNGDYALGIFSSGWCRFLDHSSRKLCKTDDNREALQSGLWHCHESCWNEASRISIETAKPVDIECRGGIHLYAVPIFAGSEIIGSINFGYGDPPRDIEKLKEIALRYGVSVEELRMHSSSYESRPFFITEIAKNRLLASARMIGEIVSRRRAEKILERQHERLEELIEERTTELRKTNEELKHAAEELKSMSDELARSNTDLQQFAYAAAHDLQEPLRVIVGFVNLLEKRYKHKLDTKGQEFIGFTIDGVKRMQQLIKDLLEYSKVGTKGLTFKPTDCSFVVDESVSNLRASIEETGALVNYDELPTLLVDVSQMTRLFQNLIGNAIKFHGEQPVRVHVSAERKRDEWVFSVQDNGIGINPQHIERIFDIFQRFHPREEYPGTGMGLAICKRIVERLGGRIWVKSEPGKGSTFYFTIPDREAAV